VLKQFTAQRLTLFKVRVLDRLITKAYRPLQTLILIHIERQTQLLTQSRNLNQLNYQAWSFD
jgi:hypothetical protein